MLSARRGECLNFSYWKENKTSTQRNPHLKTGPPGHISPSPALLAQSRASLAITAKPDLWLLCDHHRLFPPEAGPAPGDQIRQLRVALATRQFPCGSETGHLGRTLVGGTRRFLGALSAGPLSGVALGRLTGRPPDAGRPTLRSTHTQTHPGAQLLCLGGQGQAEDEKDPRWVCERGLWCWVESRATEVRGQPKFSQFAAVVLSQARGVRGAGEEQNCKVAAGGQGSPAQVSSPVWWEYTNPG